MTGISDEDWLMMGRIKKGSITSQRPNPDLLAGIHELAARYDIQPNTVAVWTQRYPDFPEPLIQVGGRVRVWWVPEVDEWYNQRK